VFCVSLGGFGRLTVSASATTANIASPSQNGLKLPYQSKSQPTNGLEVTPATAMAVLVSPKMMPNFRVPKYYASSGGRKALMPLISIPYMTQKTATTQSGPSPPTAQKASKPMPIARQKYSVTHQWSSMLIRAILPLHLIADCYTGDKMVPFCP
jgi:hypothetical protein